MGDDSRATPGSLRLTADQIPVGAWVYHCIRGTTEPARGKDGLPYPPRQRILIDGEGYSNLCRAGSFIRTAQGYIPVLGLGDFGPDTRFQPVQIYSPGNAPSRCHFAVFLDGVAMTYQTWDTKGVVRLVVYRAPSGRFSDPYAHRIELPESALLIAVHAVGNTGEI
jgi:hypothetical protein